MGTENAGQNEPSPPRLLASWKEIAALLGISVRTAQIYEKTRGLPVQRDGKRVAAMESELLEWRRRRLAELPWWANVVVLQRVAVGLAAAVVALAGLLLWTTRLAWLHVQPAYARWTGNSLMAASADGTPVWAREFPYSVVELSKVRHQLPPVVTDLDHDGDKETVTVYQHYRRESEGWDLYCFSSRGKTRWKLKITKTVQNGTRSFEPPYVLRHFEIFPSPDHDGTQWVAAVFVHHTMSPSVLMVVDSSGRPRGEYWQYGHLNVVRATDLDGDGVVELLAAGICESAHQAMITVFDPRNVHGTPPAPVPGSPLYLRDLQPATDKATIYFPRTRLNLLTEPFNFVDGLDLVGSTIQANVHETLDRNHAYLIYSLDHQFHPVDIVPSASFASALQRMGAQRDLARELGAEGIDRLKMQLRIVRH